MQAKWSKDNGANARLRISNASQRCSTNPNRKILRLHMLNIQQDRNTGSRNRAANFFQAQWKTQKGRPNTRPAKLGIVIPEKFKRMPFFGSRPVIDEAPTRETAFIYVQPRIFEPENADIIAHNFCYIYIYIYIYRR